MSDERPKSSLRLVAVIVFLVLPISALTVAATELLAWRESEDLIVRQEELLRQIDMRLARVGADGSVTVDTRAIYLRSTARSLAGADLQTLLTTAIGEAGGRLVEAQVLDEPVTGEADAVELKITFDAANAAFLTLLHGLETGLPLMTVETVAVRQLPTQDPAAAEDPLLRIDLTVRAHYKAEA